LIGSDRNMKDVYFYVWVDNSSAPSTILVPPISERTLGFWVHEFVVLGLKFQVNIGGRYSARCQKFRSVFTPEVTVILSKAEFEDVFSAVSRLNAPLIKRGKYKDEIDSLKRERKP
jgi:hypothetical protein